MVEREVSEEIYLGETNLEELRGVIPETRLSYRVSSSRFAPVIPSSSTRSFPS